MVKSELEENKGPGAEDEHTQSKEKKTGLGTDKLPVKTGVSSSEKSMHAMTNTHKRGGSQGAVGISPLGGAGSQGGSTKHNTGGVNTGF